MHNQRKIFRVFQLISFLENRPPKTIAQLVELLESSERTVYRYLDLVKACGMDVQKDKYSRFFIPKTDGQGIYFSTEEAQFLQQMILSSGKKNKLKDGILAKIYQASNLPIVEQHVYHSKNNTVIQRLTKAINHKEQVLLKKYHSINSESISDRLVEPFGFTSDYHSLMAYEPASQSNKVFHLERIKSVQFIHKSYQFEAFHQPVQTDVFGFAYTGTTYPIHQTFNLKEYLLFINEFPLTHPYFQYSSAKNRYQLTCEAFSLKPLERFLRGIKEEKKQANQSQSTTPN